MFSCFFRTSLMAPHDNIFAHIPWTPSYFESYAEFWRRVLEFDVIDEIEDSLLTDEELGIEWIEVEVVEEDMDGGEIPDAIDLSCHEIIN